MRPLPVACAAVEVGADRVCVCVGSGGEVGMCSTWKGCHCGVSGRWCCGRASGGRGGRRSGRPGWRSSAWQGRGRGGANDAGGHCCGSRGVFRWGYGSLWGDRGHQGRRCGRPESSRGNTCGRSGGSSLVAGGEYQQHEGGSQTYDEKAEMSPEKGLKRKPIGHERYRLRRTSKVQDTAKRIPAFFRQYVCLGPTVIQ